MAVENIAQRLISLLKAKRKRVLITGNGEDIRTRCPYCGDSRRNASSAHMYISLLPPFSYHCFRCEAHGVLNQQTLRDFELDDAQLSVDIMESNKHYRSKANSKKVIRKANLEFPIENKSIALHNLNYFNQRYNLHYEEKDLDYLTSKYKIIFDPITFFTKNKINISNTGFHYENAIGFVSFDQTYAVFRDTVSENPKQRYNNVALLGNDSESKTYTISTEIDPLAEKVHFIITEGIFDIIGVYNSFYKDNNENCIFIAACGKSYRTSIDTFIRLGFLNFDITIYSDADVNLEFYKDMKANSSYFSDESITIYYNTLNKDFGIPKDGIRLRKAVI